MSDYQLTLCSVVSQRIGRSKYRKFPELQIVRQGSRKSQRKEISRDLIRHVTYTQARLTCAGEFVFMPYCDPQFSRNQWRDLWTGRETEPLKAYAGGNVE